MDRFLKFTLIADGSSDKTLISIIKWSMDDLFPRLHYEIQFADFRNLPDPPKTLKEKAKEAGKYYPFDYLFIHRDAEKTDIKMVAKRTEEVRKELNDDALFERTILVVPVKMMESWLLFDKDAIKKAAGNRNYKGNLDLPAIKNIENEQQPKELLHNMLKSASGLKGRNLANFNDQKAVHLVAEFIEDYSTLRKLQAFQLFEEELQQKMGKRIALNYL